MSSRILCVLLLIICIPLVCAAEVLRVAQPQLRDSVEACGTFVVPEEGVPPEVLTSICGLLPPNAKTGWLPTVYRVPGFKQYYLMTADVPKRTGSNYGLAVYVIAKDESGYKELFVSQGAKDSFILRPTFFAGKGRTIVLAETGLDAGTTGFGVYEITPTAVRFLGDLEAARRDPKSPDNWSSPAGDAKVEFNDDNYVISFRGEIHLRPGKDGHEKLAGDGWHKFTLQGEKFVPMQ